MRLTGELPHLALQLLVYLVALAWLTRVLATHRGIPTLADLTRPEHDLAPSGSPSLTVIIPARNEAADIEASLQSLLAQDYPNLNIIAVDDRSTDQTGGLIDALAGGSLIAIHIAELPSGWLGKTNAMAVAAQNSSSDFLLFTDADIIFRPDTLRRALAYAVAQKADHLILGPTTIIRRWDEAALLSFFSVFGLWAARPWKVADPKSRRDAIGIGAFNLVRRSAYESIGGFAALRMEIVEDLALGRRIKQFGFAQRFAYGQGLVRVHWASGVPGLIDVMTKNVFAAFNYHRSLLVIGCLWLAVFCIGPFLALWYPPLTTPAAFTIIVIGYAYFLLSRMTGLGMRNALLTPFAAALFIFTLLRSMITTLRQGGVIWRGTFYPLEELRRNAAPLLPGRRV